MRFLKATREDGTVEIFNFDRILTFKPYGNGYTKILMGGGLYWDVVTDSIQLLDSPNEILQAIKEN